MEDRKLSETRRASGFFPVYQMSITTEHLTMMNTPPQNTGQKNAKISEPVILWATGGLTQRASHGLAELEFLSVSKYCHVWWNPRKRKNKTIQSLVSDLINVTEQLSRKTRDQKIYLAGFCLGTIPAIHAVATRPDLYHGYFGIAQRAYCLENDRSVYYRMLDRASGSNERRLRRKLYEIGSPDRPSIASYNYRFFRKILRRYLTGNSLQIEITRALRIIVQRGWRSLLPLRQTSKILTAAYPGFVRSQGQITSVNVPVFLFHGRHDSVVIPSLGETFFRQLQAPRKTFYWFERSGHFLFYDEQEKFHHLFSESLAQCSDPAPPGDSITQ